MKRLIPALVACAIYTCQTPAIAATILGDPIPMSALETGGSVVVGDKQFTDFFYSSTGDMPSDVNVNVIPIVDDEGNFGLRFEGAFLDLAGGGPSDALITYVVTATDPDLFIVDVHLAGNPNVVGPGAALASVTESFLPEIDDQTLSIFDTGTVIKLTDEADLTQPLKSLHVQKNIIMSASEGNAATLSFVDQTFSQDVPEPASIGLAVLAGAFLRRGRGG